MPLPLQSSFFLALSGLSMMGKEEEFDPEWSGNDGRRGRVFTQLGRFGPDWAEHGGERGRVWP